MFGLKEAVAVDNEAVVMTAIDSAQIPGGTSVRHAAAASTLKVSHDCVCLPLLVPPSALSGQTGLRGRSSLWF